MKIFPSALLQAGQEQSAAEPRSRQLEQAACPHAGEEIALLSPGLNNFLPARLQTDKRHLFTSQTGMRCTEICHIPEIKYAAYHFQSIQESVKLN